MHEKGSIKPETLLLTSLKLHEIQETAEKLQFVFTKPRAILRNENKIDADEVNHSLKDEPP